VGQKLQLLGHQDYSITLRVYAHVIPAWIVVCLVHTALEKMNCRKFATRSQHPSNSKDMPPGLQTCRAPAAILRGI
jgi:hypothetical protein